MLRRALPITFLLAALGVVAWWMLTPLAASHHGRRIFELARLHRDRQGPAWPEADAKRLWVSICWFLDHGPERLRARILEGVGSADAGDRETAVVLAAELGYYASYGDSLGVHWGPSHFPPPSGPYRHDYERFAIRTLVREHPAAFAALWKEQSLAARRSFVSLAEVQHSAAMREALERMVSLDGDEELRMDAIQELARHQAALSTTAVFRQLRTAATPRIRWAASAALARQSDPEGSCAFIAALCFPPVGLNRSDLQMQCAMMRGPFPSLEDAIGPVVEFFHDGWSPGAGLPCDLRAPWEAWLDLREREGFATEPQKARDAAYEEWERLGYP